MHLKIKNSIPLLIATVFVLGCGGKKNKVNPDVPSNKTRHLTKVTLNKHLLMEYSYDENNKLKQMNYYDTIGNIIYTTQYEYNNNGNITKAHSYNTTRGGYTMYTYDNNNLLTKLTTYSDGNNDIIGATLYSYNIGQQCIKETSRSNDYYLYEYDAMGNRTKHLIFNMKDQLLATIIYTYDNKNSPDNDLAFSPYRHLSDNSSSLTSLHNIMSITSTDSNSYDEYGRLSIDTGNDYGLLFTLYTSVFTYNSDNYPIKEIRTYSSKPQRVDVFEYEYK